MITKFAQASVACLSMLCALNGMSAAPTSIPSNIAFGNPTQGGLNGQVLRVTTLAPDGPGSLREAIMTKGPRVVVFEVGGVIDLHQRQLSIREPYLTIAGQTAPSPGITIIRGGVWTNTHNIVIQHIRVRPGDAGQSKRSGWSPDGITTSGGDAHDIIIDHCSFTWAVDENLSASGRRTEGPDATSHRITFSNNIIAECLDDSSHENGPHSKGTLVHDYCQDIAIVGNLFAHNAMRNPYFKAHATGVIVNNVIYNPRWAAIQLYYSKSEWKNSHRKPKNCRVSIVGNVLHKGENSSGTLALVAAMGDAYMEDNLAVDLKGQSIPLIFGDIGILPEKPCWPEGLKALPSKDVVKYVVRHVGARPRERDEIDQRIVQDFLIRKGRIIDSQDEVGGYPKHPETYRKLEIPEHDVEQWLARLAARVE